MLSTQYIRIPKKQIAELVNDTKEASWDTEDVIKLLANDTVNSIYYDELLCAWMRDYGTDETYD